MRRAIRIDFPVFALAALCLLPAYPVSAANNCAFGTVRQGDVCVHLKKIEGGVWHGEELRCNDGYARLQRKDGRQHCHQLTKLTNGYYSGPIAKCPKGFALVNWKCIPRSMVRDKSVIMDGSRFCPAGYTELNDVCIPKPSERRLNVGKLTLQHVYLGMTEELVFSALLDQDFQHYEDPTLFQTSRGFRKTESDGTYREIIVQLNGNPLAVYEVLYTQGFPNSNYRFGSLRSAIVQRYGAPSEVGYYRERDVLVYRDENSNRAPTLEITFPGNQVVFHLISRNLKARLIEQAHLARQREQAAVNDDRPAPKLEF